MKISDEAHYSHLGSQTMLTAVCVFCAMAAGLLHRYLGAPAGLPAVSAAIAGYLMASSIALWVRADARQRGRRLAYDGDSFVFLFWPIAVPVYLIWTRRWGAIGPMAAFVGVALLAGIFAVVLSYQRSIEMLSR